MLKIVILQMAQTHSITSRCVLGTRYAILIKRALTPCLTKHDISIIQLTIKQTESDPR